MTVLIRSIVILLAAVLIGLGMYAAVEAFPQATATLIGAPEMLAEEGGSGMMHGGAVPGGMARGEGGPPMGSQGGMRGGEAGSHVGHGSTGGWMGSLKDVAILALVSAIVGGLYSATRYVTRKRRLSEVRPA